MRATTIFTICIVLQKNHLSYLALASCTCGVLTNITTECTTETSFTKCKHREHKRESAIFLGSKYANLTRYPNLKKKEKDIKVVLYTKKENPIIQCLILVTSWKKIYASGQCLRRAHKYHLIIKKKTQKKNEPIPHIQSERSEKKRMFE